MNKLISLFLLGIVLFSLAFVSSADVICELESGSYSFSPNEDVVFSDLDEDDRTVTFLWKKLKIPEGSKVGKVEFNLYTASKKLGSFKVKIGTSTTQAPSFESESSVISQTFTSRGDSLVWNVDAKTAPYIQTKSGHLTLTLLEAECDSFVITSITAYICKGGSKTDDGDDDNKTTEDGEVIYQTDPTEFNPPPTTKYTFYCGRRENVFSSIVNKEIDMNDLKTNNRLKFSWADLKINPKDKVAEVHFELERADKLTTWDFIPYFGTTTKSSTIIKTANGERHFTSKGATLMWATDQKTSESIDTQNGQLILGIVSSSEQKFKITKIEAKVCGSYLNPFFRKNPDSDSDSDTDPDTSTCKPEKYTLTTNKKIVYSQLPNDDKMIGFEWSKFEIPTTKTRITKVVVNLSTTTSKLGKWQGAFGSSTSKSPDYWTMSEDLQQTLSGTKASLTWTLEEDIGKIIQRNYGGEFKFGVWWIDCGTFTIDSIDAYAC